MGYENLRDTGLARSVTELLADVKDLAQKEMRLGVAELKAILASRLQATAWMAVAGLLVFIAVLLVVEGMVFALASAGLSLYSCCFIVAFVVAAVAAALFFYGRSLASDNTLPTRSIRQMSHDIHTVKEQLT